jgi:hypothetical protein
MAIYKQTCSETLIDAINRLPGVEAFESNNLIRIRCLGCGHRIPFDNGAALTALNPAAAKWKQAADVRLSLTNFMAYVDTCIRRHVCSKQIPATITTTSDGTNWSTPLSPMAGVPFDLHYDNRNSAKYPATIEESNPKQQPQAKPKFSRRFDLDS